MTTQVHIDAGICGFCTKATVTCEDGQHALFAVTSDCEKIQRLATALAAAGAVDAFAEISPGSQSQLLGAARATLKGCCAACAVPVGLFKGMQVAAGLALPKDIGIRIQAD
jgi:hypothetical protein